MNNGINWEREFGMNPHMMDEGQFRMAMLSTLYDIKSFQKRCPIRETVLVTRIIKVGALPFIAFLAWLTLQVISLM